MVLQVVPLAFHFILVSLEQLVNASSGDHLPIKPVLGRVRSPDNHQVVQTKTQLIAFSDGYCG